MSKTSFKRGDVVNDYNSNDYNSSAEIVVIKKNKNIYEIFNITDGYVDNSYDFNLSLVKKKPFKVVTFKSGVYNGVVLKKGSKLFISLGCRVFYNVKAAKQHWANDGTGDHIEEDFTDYDAWKKRQKDNTKRLNAVLKAVAKVKEL